MNSAVLERSFSASLLHLEQYIREADAFVKEQHLEAIKFTLELILREVLTNAVIHGCKNNSDKKIQAVLEYSPGRCLKLKVEDEGEGFAWWEFDQELKTFPDIDNTSGRGRFIMEHYARQVEYNQKGNRVEILMDIPGKKKEATVETFEMRRDGTSLLIEMKDDLVASNLAEVKQAILTEMEEGVIHVTFDLAGIEMVDSMGIGFLVSVHNTLKKKNEGGLKVIHLSGELLDLFAAMRLDQHFTVEGS